MAITELSALRVEVMVTVEPSSSVTAGERDVNQFILFFTLNAIFLGYYEPDNILFK